VVGILVAHSVELCISPRGERLRRRFDRIQGSCLQRRLLSADPAEARQQLRPVRPEKVLAHEADLKSEFLDRRLLFDLAFYRGTPTIAANSSTAGS
jgi:hypothetical protein